MKRASFEYRVRLLSGAFLLSACASAVTPTPAQTANPAGATQVPLPPAAPPAPAASAPAPAGAPSPPPALVARFARELEQPVSDVALDAPPHVAALGEKSVFVKDKAGFREALFPPGLAGSAELRLRVFYGRDYRVRLVGTRAGKSGTESVYLRDLRAGLKPQPDELGRLGNSNAGALVAILGTADPEVVCRPGSVCLVKRISGWQTLEAPALLTHVAIADGKAWAVAGNQAFRTDREFAPINPEGPWQQAGGLFVVDERLFVLEPAKDSIHVLADAAWKTLESPVGAPRAIWGARADALWLAGASGLAYYDGQSFRLVPDAPPNIGAVLGRSATDVWFASSSGLFRLESHTP